MDAYIPKPEHKFTFDLWTVGNLGRDPFGGPVREPKTPVELVHLLAEVGAYDVNFHDNDLIPIDATPAEAETIKKSFHRALAETNLAVPMATTNLFSDPAFKNGAYTANYPRVRVYALQKTMNAIDLWGSSSGRRSTSSKAGGKAPRLMPARTRWMPLNAPVKR